jgi:hypothetical protein
MRKHCTRVVVWAVFGLVLGTAVEVPRVCRAQQSSSGPQYIVGILPFSDLSGNPDLGQLASVLPAMMQVSLLNRTSLIPRQIQPGPQAAAGAQQIMDVPTAAQVGQTNGVDLVVVGTILSGDVKTKQGSFSLGSFHGFGVGGNTNSQSSMVVIQATLVDVGRGVSLGVFRARGKDSETHIDPNATSNYGNMNMQSSQFQTSSLGKATHAALGDLTRQLAAALKKFTPAESPTPGASAASGAPFAPTAAPAPTTASQGQAPPSAPTSQAGNPGPPVAPGGNPQSSPGAATPMPAASSAPITIPAGTKIEAKYMQGVGPTLKPEEQVAILFVDTIDDLEHNYCERKLNRLCSLDELITGVSAGGSVFGLSQNPHQDPNYHYTLTISGGNYQIAAVPQRAGLGGFLCQGTGAFDNSNFYYNSQGIATTASRELGSVGFEGWGFLRQ